MPACIHIYIYTNKGVLISPEPDKIPNVVGRNRYCRWKERSVHVPNCKSFLVTEAERKHIKRRAQFQQHRDASCHQVFVPARHGAKGNSRHSDRNISVKYTIVCHRQKLGGPVYVPWFFLLCCASSWTTQNIDHSGYYCQIHELILVDCWISAKLTAEQLSISLVRFGSIIREDLAMRKLSAKCVLNAKQNLQRCLSSEQVLEFFRRDPNVFLSRLVTMDGTCLYHYDSETKQQLMEWPNSVSHVPKDPECKNLLLKFSPRFLGGGSRRLPLHWLSSKWPNCQRGILVISVGAIEVLLKEKRLGNVTKGIMFLHDKAASHRALATQKKMAYLGFHCLDNPPYSPDLDPSDYHLFPGLKKRKIGSSPFFIRRGSHCCRGDLVRRTTF